MSGNLGRPNLLLYSLFVVCYLCQTLPQHEAPNPGPLVPGLLSSSRCQLGREATPGGMGISLLLLLFWELGRNAVLRTAEKS